MRMYLKVLARGLAASVCAAGDALTARQVNEVDARIVQPGHTIAGHRLLHAASKHKRVEAYHLCCTECFIFGMKYHKCDKPDLAACVIMAILSGCVRACMRGSAVCMPPWLQMSVLT